MKLHSDICDDACLHMSADDNSSAKIMICAIPRFIMQDVVRQLFTIDVFFFSGGYYLREVRISDIAFV